MLNNNDVVSLKTFQKIDSIFSAEKVDHENIKEIMKEFAKNNQLVEYFISSVAMLEKLPALSGAQSFFLFEGEYSYARLNLWFPKPQTVVSDRYRKYLSIEENHNHNYDLYTICLMGSGYESTFYKSSGNVEYNIGDIVDAESLGRIHVTHGIPLFMEKDKIFHTQHWPDTFSVTMNIIPRKKKTTPQYVLDSSMRVKSIIEA